MKNSLQTIDLASLNNVTGGAVLDAVTQGAQGAWEGAKVGWAQGNGALDTAGKVFAGTVLGGAVGASNGAQGKPNGPGGFFSYPSGNPAGLKESQGRRNGQ